MSIERQERSRKGRMAVISCVIGVVGVVMVLCMYGPSFSRDPSKRADVPETNSVARDDPVHVDVNITLNEVDGTLDLQRVMKRVSMGEPKSLSGLIHVLRLFGKSAETDSHSEKFPRTPLLDIALDHEKSASFFQGAPVLISTRHGVRCRSVPPRYPERYPERQAHGDQFLAVLAEVGVPLNQRLSTTGGTHSVRSILEDSLANFDLKQDEVEWAALAYALYLPPRKDWLDKFNRPQSFNKLAAELIDRPFGGYRSCAGTHLLYSLVTILRVDEQQPILSSAMRAKLREHLQHVTTTVVGSQLTDGSWDINWYDRDDRDESRDIDAKSTMKNRVLVCGHHLEWMMLLPRDMLPPTSCFLRGARFLERQLLLASPEAILEGYCPYSHAARVLQLLTRT